MELVHETEAPLAIHGGRPVRKTLLPYGRQQIDPEDIQAVSEVLHSDWITTGPKVSIFEEALAEYVGARYAVSFSSGTAALHGAAFAGGLGQGDEAITTPLTFCATANCVLYQGAAPVFVDVCSDTLNIDPEQISKVISSRTKAIIPVDYAGNPANYDLIMELAAKYGLVLIEDAAHALGAEYKGRKLGSLAHMTIFSFHPVKHITTGEGGMVTTDSRDFAERLRMFRNHGINRDLEQRQTTGQWQYDMVELGYNYRLTDIGSALGLSQLSKIEEKLMRRRKIAKQYQLAFKQMPGIILPEELPETVSAWHIFPVRFNSEIFTGLRNDILSALRAENIGVNVHYIPLHYHTYYRNRFGYKGGEFPNVEAAYESLLSLPIFPAMSEKDINDVINAVKKVTHYFLDFTAG